MLRPCKAVILLCGEDGGSVVIELSLFGVQSNGPVERGKGFLRMAFIGKTDFQSPNGGCVPWVEGSGSVVLLGDSVEFFDLHQFHAFGRYLPRSAVPGFFQVTDEILAERIAKCSGDVHIIPGFVVLFFRYTAARLA